MAETAARLVDEVLPDAPYRQWVLSLPPPLRYLLAYDAKLTSKVLGFFVKAISSWQRHQAKAKAGLNSVSQAHTGSVTAIQRFGSALNLNLHLHTMAPDGVYVQRDNGTLEYIHIGAPSVGEERAIGWDVCQRTIAHLRKEGRWYDEELGGGDTEDTLYQEHPLLAEIYNASLLGRLAMGPRSGQRVMRLVPHPKLAMEAQGVASEDFPKKPPTPYGFDVHARVSVPKGDRQGLERLCRYFCRPPAAASRFQWHSDGRIALKLKRRWSDGTTHILLTPLELAEKLAALIPTPRAHQIRYHGLFAPRHKHRDKVVPGRCKLQDKKCCGERQTRTGTSSPYRMAWAMLMKRVFDFEVLRCPKCGSDNMQTIAFITQQETIDAILDSVGRAGDSPAEAA